MKHVTTKLRQACPDCKGCDTCFHAGRSHEINLLKEQNATLWARVQAGIPGAGWRQRESEMLRIRNANAYAAKLGAKIHRLREIARAHAETRLLNKSLQESVSVSNGELTPDLLLRLSDLDAHLEGAARARKAAYLAVKEIAS